MDLLLQEATAAQLLGALRAHLEAPADTKLADIDVTTAS
jgi:hypothetical protein